MKRLWIVILGVMCICGVPLYAQDVQAGKGAETCASYQNDVNTKQDALKALQASCAVSHVPCNDQALKESLVIAQEAYDNCVYGKGDNSGRRGQYGRSPEEILHNVVKKRGALQNTALDTVTHVQGQYPARYRIANTFDVIRKKTGPYIDWMFYIGLSVATILIIVQGLQLVIGKTFADIRPKMINIVVGVMVLTGTYLILKLVLGVIGWIFNV